MAQELSAGVREALLRATRAIFPHDDLPDEAYLKVVDALQADAASDDGVRATIEAGAGDLDGQLEPASREEGSDLFRLIHASAVVELYDNPLVWRAFGYEGPAVHLGGYVDRGFDDLDWLPDPPTALDAAAGSHHRQEAS
jgi:hypothetical protein